MDHKFTEHAPVAIGERAAEYLTDEFCDVSSEKLHHIGVALNVGQRPAIERLFPERDDECHSKHRVGAVFTFGAEPPKESNIIVFDDFVTTGSLLMSVSVRP